MKIKPKIYAEMLLESIKDEADMKKIAGNLWRVLQKNKQYKELPVILDELEKAYAAREGLQIAYVESAKELTARELEEIQGKLSSYCHFDSVKPVEKSLDVKLSKDLSAPLRSARDDNKIIIKVKVNAAITGILAKTGGQIIDLSLENKINQLRKQLNT